MAIKITAPKKPSVPSLPSAVATDFALIQNQYPKIGEKISVMWGSVALKSYLNDIIFDERGGRQGFPLPVVSALLRVAEYHATLIPESESKDTWDGVLR